MDPVTLLVGAGILLAGVLIGEVHGRIAARRQRPDPPPQPICGCTHHRSMHDNGGEGECMAAVAERAKRSETGVYLGMQPVGCACQQYVGPVPIETLWQPPVLPEGSDR